MKINFYERMGKPSIKSTITIEEWLNLIRKSDYSNQITEVRKKPSKKAFDDLKEILPCVTYNFLYDKYKRDKNLIGSTGLLLIDVDSPEFQIENLDNEKVLAYYKSVQGGNRYHIIVRVDGLTYANFHSTYEKICLELNLSTLFDKYAKKHSQYSVLSFHEDAYYNDNPYVFIAAPDLSNTCIPIVSNIQKKKTYTYDRDTPIRFDNLDEIEIPESQEYIVNWDGFDFIRAWIPIKKKKDGRKRFLLSYTTNLVYLNQHLNYEKLILILHNVSNAAFEVPLPPDRIQDTLKSVMKQLMDATLKPIYYRYKRKIVFNKKALLDRASKQGIVLQELAIKKTNDSIRKIQTLIKNWDKDCGTITARKLFTLRVKNGLDIKISSKTINKYYKHFKNEIKEINDVILASTKKKNNLKVNKNNNLLDNLYVFNTEETNYKYCDYLTVIRNINAEASAPIKATSPTMDVIDPIALIKKDIHNCLNKCDEITFDIQIELFNKVKQIAKLDSSIRPDVLYSELLRQYSYKKVA